MSDQAGLERFEMQSSYGRLLGVAVACHAIRDGYLLMHAGVGCKDKVTHLLAHDWEQHCNLRQGWTEVDERELIRGATGRVGPYVRSWQGRMDSGVVCVTTASFLEMTGEDLAAEVRRIDEQSPVPVVLVPAPGADGDEFDGYAAATCALMERLDWSERQRQPQQISLLGYWFDRYEGDHHGNLTQIAGMLKAIGLNLGPVLWSGVPFGDSVEAGRSGLLVELPYLRPGRRALDRLWTGHRREPPLRTDLPMGFAGTRRWLHEVGAAAGVDPRRIASYADRREQRARQPLQKMASRWRSLRVAVLAEPPLAAGICSVLLELGIRPVLVALRGQSLGGSDELRGVLERDGLRLPVEAEVLPSPSLATLRDALRTRLAAGELDGVLGSATEQNLLTTLSPAELGGADRDRRGPFVLELGFPCWHYHAVQQMPFMGYGGVITLAQRLIDPPRLWDAARGAVG